MRKGFRLCLLVAALAGVITGVSATAAITGTVLQPVAGDLSGEYQGPGDGGSATATIRRVGGEGLYHVALELVGTDGHCGGGGEGRAVLENGVIKLTIRLEHAPEYVCQVAFRPTGRGLQASFDNCYFLSGASCGFQNGLYARTPRARRR